MNKNNLPTQVVITAKTNLTFESLSQTFAELNKIPDPIYYGMLMCEKMYDRLIEFLNPTDVKFDTHVRWSGMVIGIHDNIPDGYYIPAKNKEQYVRVYNIAEHCPELLIEMLEES